MYILMKDFGDFAAVDGTIFFAKADGRLLHFYNNLNLRMITNKIYPSQYLVPTSWGLDA